MSNGNRRLLDVPEVVRSARFRTGFRECMRGQPFADQWIDVDRAVEYEVGRLTAAQLLAEGSKGFKVYFSEAGRVKPGRSVPLERACCSATSVWWML